ncbi:dTDP-4-amino-4,6-dideoxygalactose transaminase [Lacimicrobium sp. SS2-24]|uniref:dTDP-4-amino-4,6-dideoxygalactose transaminase n=1 Tax=Lacimicrobium sp. SS2-24 TaxID=2005569 RepID=UPI000B4C032B|nr:dTDP-4-amino-4,6-dideoxygalactose transaminase [Lacimicrobium sp. SS2-24]
MIPFNRAPYTGDEDQFIHQALASRKLSGNGYFSEKCEHWFEQQLGCQAALVTPSCTQALEMAAILIDIQPGDEVIMPSFTFVSTANAFVLRGARIRFVDIRPDTMNIDEDLIELAINDKTKAIVVVHYAGRACNMDKVMDVATRNDLYVIEDAAQAICSFYKGRPLGTIGHIGAFSFHETKNITSAGEGGLLIINRSEFCERAEIIREKGTNRKLFIDGLVDKYSWVDVGSSFLTSELQSAYLWGQLPHAEKICKTRLIRWQQYYDAFSNLPDSVERPLPLASSPHNGHIFYLKAVDEQQRQELIQFLGKKKIKATFHYVPLHSSEAGRRFGTFNAEDIYTTSHSKKLIRLPLWYGMEETHLERVVDAVKEFYAV